MPTFIPSLRTLGVSEFWKGEFVRMKNVRAQASNEVFTRKQEDIALSSQKVMSFKWLGD